MGLGITGMKLWKERLDFADEVWRQHGLGKDAPTTWDGVDVIDYLQAYRGQQWKGGFGGLSPEDCMVVNLIFTVTNTQIATLNARHPVVDVFAESPEFVENARNMERTLNFLLRKRDLHIKREINRVLRDALLMPFGCIRHGILPPEEIFDDDGNRIESFGAAKPNIPFMKRLAPWDIRIDPTGDSFDPDQAGWCAFRSLHFMDDLKKNQNLTIPRDLEPTVSYEKLMLYPEEMQKFQDLDTAKLVELWTIYNRRKRTWMTISPGSDKPIRDEDDWPVPWENLPYNLLQFNEQADDPFGVPFPRIYWQQQVEMNKIRTMMSELAKRIRRVVFVNGDALAEGEADKLTDDADLHEFFMTDGVSPSDVVREVQVGTIPQELIQYVGMIEEDVRKAVGVGELNRAQRINVETAAEANAVVRGQDLQTGRNQGPFEDFMADATATFSETLQQSIDSDLLVPILGAEDAASLLQGQSASPFLRVGPKQIEGDFVIEIRPNSMLARDVTEEQRKATAWLQLATPYDQNTNIPEALLNLARAFDLNPQKVLLTADERQGLLDQLQTDAQQGFAPEAGGGNGAAGAASPSPPQAPAFNGDLGALLGGDNDAGA